MRVIQYTLEWRDGYTQLRAKFAERESRTPLVGPGAGSRWDDGVHAGKRACATVTMDKIKGVLEKKGGKGRGKGRGRGAAPPGGAPPPVDGVVDAKLPVIVASYELPDEETDALKLRLRAHLLSPAAATQGGVAKARDIKLLTTDELGQLLRKCEMVPVGRVVGVAHSHLVRYVDHIDTMFDRTGNLDLVTLMGLTYANGLPIYASNAAVQAHTVLAMQTIMSELAHGTRSEEFKRKTLARLVDAARACQAEQARDGHICVWGLLTPCIRGVSLMQFMASSLGVTARSEIKCLGKRASVFCVWVCLLTFALLLCQRGGRDEGFGDGEFGA